MQGISIPPQCTPFPSGATLYFPSIDKPSTPTLVDKLL